MKINQEMRGQVDAAQKNMHTAVDGKKSFESMVQSQAHKLKQQGLKQLMEDITLQGDKLARFRSFKDLAKFKRMVKGFLQETVHNGLDLHQSHSFNLDGDNRNLTLVKEVDDKLVALTEEMMNQEKKTVDLLGIIGEIKGLLVNLYS